MSSAALFFLKFAVLLFGVYIIIRLTPYIADWLDKHRKNSPEAPRPERVDDDFTQENSGEELSSAADDNTHCNNKDQYD